MKSLRNAELQIVLGTRLKFYTDNTSDTTAILSHVLASETGMPVLRPLQLVEDNGNLCVSIRWKELSSTEDTLEPLHRVYKDVSKLLVKLLHCKTTNAYLSKKKSCIELGLEERECGVY